jgi:GNAT superfamily N-acetyltransferase
VSEVSVEPRMNAQAGAVPGAPTPPPQIRPGTVLVRLARDEADITAMIALGMRLHAESRFRDMPLDEKRLWAAGRRGLAEHNPALIVAERDGAIVGMAVVMVGEHFFSPVRTATVQLIYVAPQARGGSTAVKLLRALRRWSTDAGALDLHINVTTGIAPARTDRMLRRMGFRQTGGNYVLEGIQD